MRKIYMLLVWGIWIAVLPYLGFPSSWKDILFTLSGLALIYISYMLYGEYKIKDNIKTFDNFSENDNFKEKETNKQEDIKQEEI